MPVCRSPRKCARWCGRGPGKLRKSDGRLQTCMRGYLNVRVDDLVPDPGLVRRLKAMCSPPGRPAARDFPQPAAQKLPVWKEGKTEEFMCLPRHLGLRLFGPPDKDLSVGGDPASHPRLSRISQALPDKGHHRGDRRDPGPRQRRGRACRLVRDGENRHGDQRHLPVEVKTAIVVQGVPAEAVGRAAGPVRAGRGGSGAEGTCGGGRRVRRLALHGAQPLSEDRYPRSMFEPFGLVVFDETHHISARTFMQAAGMFPARRRLGLTATRNGRTGWGICLPGSWAPSCARPGERTAAVWRCVGWTTTGTSIPS